MGAANEHLSGLATGSLDRLEAIVRRFEDAWQRGPRPDLRAFAPPGQVTHALLIELTLIDLEYRLQAGEPVRVETYLEWCPELRADRNAVLTLVRAEYERRRRDEPRLGVEEYLARFPQYGEELAPLGGPPEPHPTPPLKPGSGTADLASTIAHPSGSTNDAAPQRPADDADSLPSLPDYEILEVIGRGGMGVVLKARHRPLNRLVALKMPLSHQLAGDADRERFLREARSAARLHHPHICPIYEVGEHDGRPYLAMRFIRGETLKAWTARVRPTARQAAEVVAALARAVGYAHEHGVIHRDIKPANVIVDGDTGQPVLTDFGLAKELAEQAAEMTQSGQILGTPAYMAPEQAAGRTHEVGPAADVYALGVVLYELLTGRLPFAGGVGEILHRVQSEEPPPPRKLAPRLHRDLETICLKAMAKVPRDRYLSPAALAEDLDRFGAGEAILARRERLTARVWRKVRRRPAVAVALLAGILAAGATVLTVSLLLARRTTDEVNALKRDFEARLAPPDRSAAALARAEALLAQQKELDTLRAELDRLDATEAAALPRLDERVAELLRDSWRQRVNPGEVKRIEAALTALAARGGALGSTLRNEFQLRARKPQLAFDLDPRAPSGGLGSPAEVFTAPAPQVVGKALVRGGEAGKSPVILTQVACRGNVQLEALFASPSWEDATELSLLLNAASAKERGYYFGLRTLPLPSDPDAKKPAPLPTFGKARQAGGLVSLQIRHGSDRLREQQFKASDLEAGPLYLRAEREGSQLTFQVGKRTPVRFQDAFLLSAGEPGVFGLHWPAGVRVARLWAWEQAVAPGAGPLDLGDHLDAQDRLGEAQVEYRKVAQSAREPRYRLEARYKESLCLLRANDDRKAGELLEEVAAARGDREEGHWALLAQCRLWLLCLRQEKYDRADELYHLIAPGYEFEKLALLVPEYLREEIRLACRPARGLNPFRVDPGRVSALELAVKISDLFEAPELARYMARWDLFLAYNVAGQSDRAMRQAEEIFRVHPRFAWTYFALAEHYCWLLRQRDPRRALEFLATLPPETRTLQPSRRELQIERARTLAVLGRLDEAERCLDAYFAALPPCVDARGYRWYAEAWLVRGFVREAKGDRKGAEDAWRKGIYRNWRRLVGEGDPGDKGGPKDHLPGLETALPTLYATILGSLAGDMTDAEANAFIDGAQRVVGPNAQTALMGQVGLRPSPDLIRGLWRDGRGRAYARRIGLQTIPYAELARGPLQLLGVAVLREKAFKGPLTAEQEGILWQLTDDVARFSTAELWKLGPPLFVTLRGGGPANPLGWKALAANLQPKVRGPLAYVLGHRYLTYLNRPDDAAGFFTAALTDAPAGSPLERLARTGLAHARRPTSPERQ
ncbi:MAG: protein kinase [Gemmataceae bacterium]|nr:protein kinase [Gemmataceae bacterium]